jgi:hypothetical protein
VGGVDKRQWEGRINVKSKERPAENMFGAPLAAEAIGVCYIEEWRSTTMPEGGSKQHLSSV